MQQVMLGNPQAQGRQFVDLASLDPPGRAVWQCLLAGPTPLGLVDDDRVRRRDQRHLMAAMPRLAARLLPARLAQALRLAGQAVTRRRLRAVVAVLGPLLLECFDFGEQPLHLLAQGGILGAQGG